MERRFRNSAIASVAIAMLVALAGTASATPRSGPAGLTKHATRVAPHNASSTDEGDAESQALMDRSEQYAAVRTAPAAAVSAEAFQAAARQARALPVTAGSWQELTTLPYNSDAVGYRDPFWSNSSGGAGLVAGRMSAIVSDGDVVYAGAADGGVWKSLDHGKNWTPIFDRQTRLSVGALAIDPADHSLWVGTGEANTAFENYEGDGIYRSANGGHTWQLVGDRLDNSLVSRITFDGYGHVYAATAHGLVRRDALDLTSDWTTVLKPDPNPDGSPYRTSWISDVRVRPGTHGQEVVAVLGWRGGTPVDTYSYNGFYVSKKGGADGTWKKVASPGITGLIGRTSLDYGPDGQLYAIVEAPDTVALNGVYVSVSGDGAGPWTLLADNAKLAAAPNTADDDPGAQAWYDQYVLVDPNDAAHIYVGLKEIYESSDGGSTWTVIGPYWNFPFSCWSADPDLNTCPNTTHPDQHAAWVASDGTAYFANDGGMYSRPAKLRSVVKWHDLNATLRTLQYYYAGIGRWPGGGDAIYGGLQDNGTSLLRPGAATMVSPFGGDGGDVLVDPNNAKRAVNEYVYLTMARTENGGRSDGTTRSYTTITPTCASFIGIEFQPRPCDHNPRFIAPYVADATNIDHWVAGGQKVWDNQGKGWKTVCTSDTCDWKPAHVLKAPSAQTTALGVVGDTIYAGWCGNGCNPGGTAPFISGIDTNYGGGWHTITAPNLPNRIPTSFSVDPTDPGHVFVTFGAFSRRWIAGAGVGHVFESTDGGATWTDRSGNLPDAPANDVVVVQGQLLVGTDVGVFATSATAPGAWTRFGTDLPNASTNDLAVAPGSDYVVAATHGRGLWRFTF
jgi:hypothetical protein